VVGAPDYVPFEPVFHNILLIAGMVLCCVAIWLKTRAIRRRYRHRDWRYAARLLSIVIYALTFVCLYVFVRDLIPHNDLGVTMAGSIIFALLSLETLHAAAEF
jgi:hypothetical protein